MSTVKQISTLAKKIYAKKPTMKWTDAIKQASRELKASGKISAGKSRATKSTATKRKPVTKRITGVAKKKTSVPSTIKLDKKNLNSTHDKYKYKARYYEVHDDQDGDLYIMYGGKAIYFKKPYPRIGAVKKTVKTKTKTTARKVSGSHTDTKSHNVRINVLSGLKSQPMVFNGVNSHLKKGKYYLWQGYNFKGTLPNTTFADAVLMYQGRERIQRIYKSVFDKGGASGSPLMFKIWYKTKQGYSLTDDIYLPANLAAFNFKPIKKPTLKELAIGHLKLPK